MLGALPLDQLGNRVIIGAVKSICGQEAHHKQAR
jgi:hypothetical protein